MPRYDLEQSHRRLFILEQFITFDVLSMERLRAVFTLTELDF